MKKMLIHLSICTAFLINLMGCSYEFPEKDSNQPPKQLDLKQLTRVDVQISQKKTIENELIITDEQEIKILRDICKKIEWEYNVKPEMTRNEDMKAILFYTVDKNMPEKLVEYYIWFDASATFMDREKNALGTLNKEDAHTLKGILMNKRADISALS